MTPQWRVPIKLADGRQEEWSATEILLTINGRTLHTTCLFAPPDGEQLPRDDHALDRVGN